MREGLPSDGLSIERRCSQNWNDHEREGRYFHCAQCDEKVFDVSSLTYREYVQWLADRSGRGSVCVRVRVDSEHRIVLRDEPEPKRRLPIVTAAAVAATLAAAPGCEKRTPSAPVVAISSERASSDAGVASELGTSARVERAIEDSGVASSATPSVEAADSGVASNEPERSPDTMHVTDAGRIVRVRHPHPPGRHVPRRPYENTDDLAGGLSL